MNSTRAGARPSSLAAGPAAAVNRQIAAATPAIDLFIVATSYDRRRGPFRPNSCVRTQEVLVPEIRMFVT
jgi:hypothetical protein